MAFFHTGWIVLNLGLSTALLVIFYRNFRSFSERYGWLPSLILFLLTASMCQSPTRNQPQQAGLNEQNIPFPKSKSYWSTTSTISLIDFPTLSLSQRVFITHPSNSDSIRVSSHTYLTGATVGVSWVPMNSQVTIRSDKRIDYSVGGILEWQLLHFTVYRQPLYFTGESTRLKRDLSDFADLP